MVGAHACILVIMACRGAAQRRIRWRRRRAGRISLLQFVNIWHLGAVVDLVLDLHVGPIVLMRCIHHSTVPIVLQQARARILVLVNISQDGGAAAAARRGIVFVRYASCVYCIAAAGGGLSETYAGDVSS